MALIAGPGCSFDKAGLMAHVAGRIHKNLPAVGGIVRDHVHDVLDTPGPPRSEAGQPPHIDYSVMDDGTPTHEHLHPGLPHLFESWHVEMVPDRLVVSIVSTNFYAASLEYGWEVAPRPFAHQALAEAASQSGEAIAEELGQ